MVFVALGIVLASFVFLYLLWIFYTDTSKYNVPVFKKRNIPLFGHMLSMPSRLNMLNERLKWYTEMGDSFIFWSFHQLYIFSRDPKVLEDLLSSQKYLKKGFGYWILQEGLGDGLVVSEGDLWRKRRKMITPTFHFEILNDYFSTMQEQSANLIKKLRTLAEKKREFDVLPLAKIFTFSVICETAMGINMEEKDKKCGFDVWVKTVVRLVSYRLQRPWIWHPMLFKLTKDGRDYFRAISNMKNFVGEVIERRIKLRNENLTDTEREMSGPKQKKRIFIDTLLDSYSSGDIDVKGLIEEVFTFINAGHETTSSVLSWSLYLLGRNPEIQEKVYREIQEIGDKYDDLFDGLKELKYLECIIKESMRIHPGVPNMGRKLEKDTVLGGTTFPSAPNVFVDIIALHRNPKIWENPMSFVPERFEKLSENQKRIFAFLPFSAGPRNCIGQKFAMMELKVALFHILKNFCVIATQSEDEVQETASTILTSDNGLMLLLKERNSTD